MRIHWIDNLKGIGIILIVLGHCFFPEQSLFISYIFSFHIILFFFLSGLTFHAKKYVQFRPFIINKFQRLIIPYIFFNLIMFSFVKAKDIFSGTYNIGTDFLSFLQGILYGSYLIIPDNGNYFLIPDHTNILNVPTWFLVCLFMVSIGYFWIHKLIPKRGVRLGVLLLFSGIIYAESKYMYFRFPLSSEIALMSMLFYGIGHSFQNEILQGVEKINGKYLFLMPLLIGLNLWFLSSTNINFSSNFYGDSYLAFIGNGFLGTLCFIILAKNIPQNKFLDFFGQNSLIVVGFEGIKVFVLKGIIFLSFGYIVFERSYLTGMLQLIGTLAIITLIIIIINSHFRYILGDFKKK